MDTTDRQEPSTYHGKDEGSGLCPGLRGIRADAPFPVWNMVVNKEQAETVKLIYRLYLEGYSAHAVAKELTKRGCLTPYGEKKKWHDNTVLNILRNEKYRGDALLQKYFTVDFLTKKLKVNRGEVRQYYVHEHHEPIISPEVFDWVQREMKRRKECKFRYCGVSIYTSKIFCGECGGVFGPKVWHSTDKYRRTVYRCNDRYKNYCHTPRLTIPEIQESFIKAVNKLLEGKDEVIANIRLLQQTVLKKDELLKEQARYKTDMNALADLTNQCMAENARKVQDQKEYEEREKSLLARYEAAKKRYEDITAKIHSQDARNEQLELFIRTLEKQGVVTTFDETLWATLLESITVYGKDDIRVKFRDGTVVGV